MDKFDAISSLFWKFSQDTSVGKGIEGSEVLQISPKACSNARPVIACGLVKPGLDMLVWSSSLINLSKVAVVND